VRIGLLGGLRVEHDGASLAITGSMQRAVLFRLAVDAGSAASYRAISEDVWGADAPENTRASLQSIVSRLRLQLPDGSIESTAGGYRLAIGRSDVDALRFSDLVAAATGSSNAGEASRLATDALALWAEPWIPSDNFDWFERDIRSDRAKALELGGSAAVTPDASRTIPVPLTSLVGRETELAMIAEQLAGNRLVTIVGTGGAGKTRLAIETAARARGALIAELAPVGSAEVLTAIQTATGRELRAAEVPTEPKGARERVLEALYGRDVLLVLDNCEHVIDEAARVAEDLLGALPGLRILATSREPLAIPGEAFVAVGSLPHPLDAEIAGSDDLLAFAAVELFAQRSAAARGIELDPAELIVAARITARLDGLPLALELAAAKLRTMTVDEVLAGLEHRFTLLTGGYRTALPRHQTLRAMIDWSWSLLVEEERTALAHLAVFPSGVDSGDAGALAARIGLSSPAVFDSLVDKSLLQRSRGRYRTLETVREYGIERLAESGTVAAARELQARHAADRATAVDVLLRGAGINEAIAWFDAEEENIVAALRYAVTVPLDETAIILITACTWYWTIRDRGEDARTWFGAVAPLAQRVDSDEGKVISVLGSLISAFSDGTVQLDSSESIERALELLEPLRHFEFGAGRHELLQLFPPAISAFGAVMAETDWMLRVRMPRGEDLGLDTWPTAMLHVMRAAMAQNRGDVDELGVESELAVFQFAEVGDLWGLALSQQMRANWLVLKGRLDEALALNDESTGNMRRITSSWDLAQQQTLAVSILARGGRFDEARERVAEMFVDADRSGNPRTHLQVQLAAVQLDLMSADVASAGTRLSEIEQLVTAWPNTPPQLIAMISASKGWAEILRGNFDDAENHLRAAVVQSEQSHDQPVMGMVAITVGTLALSRGDLAEALRAVELADWLIGAHDATDPQVRAIEAAAIDAGVGRNGTEVPSRPAALEAFGRLMGSSAR
jgi:predicted ATPase